MFCNGVIVLCCMNRRSAIAKCHKSLEMAVELQLVVGVLPYIRLNLLVCVMCV